MTSPADGTTIPGSEVCFRHPQRRAGVRCQRCERPICPSCMTTASVGFHCPDCAGPKPSARSASRAGQASPVTMGLIGVNVVVFVLEALQLGALAGGYADLRLRFALFADAWVPGVGDAGVASGEWWRLLTSGFLHAGIVHLAFNMIALYSVGSVLERVIGSIRFGLIYLVSVLGGSLGALLLTDPNVPTVGASGGIFGLFASFAVLELSRGLSPMRGGIGPTILLNLFITFAIPGISIGGHIGGLLLGAASGGLLIGLNRRQAIERARDGGMAVAAVAALALSTAVMAVLVAHLRV